MDPEDDQLELVAEEIRWEYRGYEGGSGMCTCSHDGDGPPCPHGNFDIEYKKVYTEAEWAKKALEDWEWEGEDDKDEDYDAVLIPPEVLGDFEDEEPPEFDEGLGFNFTTTAPKLTDEQLSQEGENKNWWFNESTEEWEES